MTGEVKTLLNESNAETGQVRLQGEPRVLIQFQHACGNSKGLCTQGCCADTAASGLGFSVT